MSLTKLSIFFRLSIIAIS